MGFPAVLLAACGGVVLLLRSLPCLPIAWYTAWCRMHATFVGRNVCCCFATSTSFVGYAVAASFNAGVQSICCRWRVHAAVVMHQQAATTRENIDKLYAWRVHAVTCACCAYPAWHPPRLMRRGCLCLLCACWVLVGLP